MYTNGQNTEDANERNIKNREDWSEQKHQACNAC